jgi:hypothetical protein
VVRYILIETPQRRGFYNDERNDRIERADL